MNATIQAYIIPLVVIVTRIQQYCMLNAELLYSSISWEAQATPATTSNSLKALIQNLVQTCNCQILFVTSLATHAMTIHAHMAKWFKQNNN